MLVLDDRPTVGDVTSAVVGHAGVGERCRGRFDSAVCSTFPPPSASIPFSLSSRGNGAVPRREGPRYTRHATIALGDVDGAARFVQRLEPSTISVTAERPREEIAERPGALIRMDVARVVKVDPVCRGPTRQDRHTYVLGSGAAAAVEGYKQTYTS